MTGGEDRAAYMRDYRAARPGYKREELKRRRAVRRALNELAARHAAEYARLLAAEQDAAGLPPPRRRGRR